MTYGLKHIETRLTTAHKHRAKTTFGCETKFWRGHVAGGDYMDVGADNSDLLDSLLELADKGDLGPGWSLHVWPDTEPTAWFTFADIFVNFTPWPELLDAPMTHGDHISIIFRPGVKLADAINPNPPLGEEPSASTDNPLTEDEIPF